MVALTAEDLRRLPRDKQLALGRGLRDGMPRRRLGELSAEPGRDPIAVLAAQNKARILSLVPVRRERMSESPFAFYRGAAAVMASDLAGTASTGVLIQTCGDAHLSNFGLFASRDRALLFDVNDFDETAVGPWEWDVKRLVTSVAILGDEFGMSGDAVRQTAIKTVAAYRARMNELAQMSALDRFYVKWLHRGPHVGLLRAIALGNKPLEEGSFADPNGGKGLLYLRSLLAASGALPANDVELTRLRHWFEHEISPLPTSRRLILTQYFNWVLLPRAKRDQMTCDVLPSAANHVRVATRGIAGFLGWLDTEHNIDLCDLTKSQVDEYTSTRSTSRWLPRFLAWATRNNHSPNSVEAPNPVPSLPAATLSEQQADAIVTHLITNTTITAGTRFGLLLIAIYGIPATRVVGLERTQVAITGSQVALIMGDHRLSLPGPVGNLVISHQAEIDRTPGRWLFPGRQPGKHVNVQILRRRLDAYNVTLAELQTAARYRLAAGR